MDQAESGDGVEDQQDHAGDYQVLDPGYVLDIRHNLGEIALQYQVRRDGTVLLERDRQARLEWMRSGHDFIGDESQIVEYAVYRRIAADGLGSIGVFHQSPLYPAVLSLTYDATASDARPRPNRPRAARAAPRPRRDR